MKISLKPFLQNGKDGLFLHEPTNGSQTSVFNRITDPFYLSRPLSRSLMKINLITLLLGLGLSQVDASTYAQQVTLRRQKTSLEAVLKDFEKQSGYTFFYKKTDVTSVKGMNVDVKNMPLNQALNQVLKEGNFTFEYFDKTIVIKKGRELKSQAASLELPQTAFKASEVNLQQSIRGRVLDENGKPIKGASVREKSDSRRSVATQEDGTFTLPITSLNEFLIISYLGYQTKEVKASLDQNQMLIRLILDDREVDEVVVTGITQRKKDSFTGATATFSGVELKQVSNQNIISALRSLDPSFVQVENNSMGSNPNALPKIELRGQTSISTSSIRDEFSSDPNQPLFILDGFETNLRTIVDLDMNIIQSVTLLKDAASTAIYGSRASNGVVVIETIKPKAGSVKLSYSTDMQVQSPDLRSYNMMDAAEKLQFEKLSGRYTSTYGIIQQQLELDQLYDERLERVLRGVNTYWLDKPLHTGFAHRHSLNARGGEGSVVFDVGVNYRNTEGTMVGSGRQDWGGNVNINYRQGKLNIANRAFITGYNNENSPYGSFSIWANANPYFEVLTATEKYLDYRRASNETDLSIANPFYNASLNSFDQTKNYTVNNNIQLTYDFNNIWRLTAGGQISKGNINQNIFTSPLNSKFDNTVNVEKGSLEHAETNNFSYTGNIMLTYAKIWHEKHSLTSNVRAEISENQNKLNGYVAVGFPSTSNGNPAFSYGFATDSKPRSLNSVSRRTSILGSFNYSYDQRYNADFNYNLDGSTSFGSAHQFAPYYSFGASWNVHKEHFMEQISWINLLRLRGNIGVTGNQNFGNISQSVFTYITDINRFGQGIVLETLGAPDLRWQKTRQTSVGIDAVVFQNRLNVQLNAYDKLTDPLVVAVTLPSSTGLDNYPFNAGNLNYKGIETDLLPISGAL